MSDLVEHVGKSIVERRLLRAKESVLVAVSGGVDSMVLLHLLAKLAPKHRWQLVVGHFNHCLRGRSSEADERLVREAAEKLGLEVVVERAEVRGYAVEAGISIEMAARKLRHDFFARTARRLRIRTVALAHQADDQVELFFLRLLRGSGSEGLGGMHWRNPSPATAEIQLVRPLLDQPREVLMRFAEKFGIRFREDATNADVEVKRNRVRRKLIPLLVREYQPALRKVILRQMEILRSEGELGVALARQWLANGAKSAFSQLPVSVQRHGLQIQLISEGLLPNFDLIEQLREAPEQPITVSDGMTVCRNKQGKVHCHRAGAETFIGGQKAVNLTGKGGALAFAGVEFGWETKVVRAGIPLTSRSSLKCEHFDADKVGTSIVLRHWQPGDRFQPIGMGRAVKLHDLFINRKVLRAQRHQLIVGVTAGGELFWVEGLRMAERFKLDAGTRRRLQWQWKRL